MQSKFQTSNEFQLFPSQVPNNLNLSNEVKAQTEPVKLMIAT